MKLSKSFHELTDVQLKVIQLDGQYEEHLVKDVTFSDLKDDKLDMFLSLEGSGHFSLEVGDGDPFIRVGDTVRLYGRGFGFPVRGFVGRGHVYFYRTEDEDKERHRVWVEEERMKRENALQKERVDRDLRIQALPEVFQKRIHAFQKAREHFRRDHEPYELFCCEQAVALAAYVHSEEALEAFSKMSFEDQKFLVPVWSNDHSGNTASFSILLANIYQRNQELHLIEKCHGALCPLVGCKEYGCWSTRSES